MIASWKHSAKRSFRLRSERGPARATIVQVACVALASALTLPSCGGLQKKVERRRDQQIEVGRRVSGVAYAWYARARFLHRQGELVLAREAYREALDADPRSGAAYAGLGASYCETERTMASETFARGLRKADETLPIYLARGRCELLWGEPAQALVTAEQAFSLEPAAPETSALLVDALASTGRLAQAQRVERAQRMFAGLGKTTIEAEAGTAAVDSALRRGDLARAEALSLEVMPASHFAARALALGHVEYAAEQAALVFAAAPNDRTAWAVLLLTRPAATPPEPDGPPPDELALCLLGERVRTEAGLLAAEAYLRAAGPASPELDLGDWRTADDPLLVHCANRLLPSTVRPTSARP